MRASGVRHCATCKRVTTMAIGNRRNLMNEINGGCSRKRNAFLLFIPMGCCLWSLTKGILLVHSSSPQSHVPQNTQATAYTNTLLEEERDNAAGGKITGRRSPQISPTPQQATTSPKPLAAGVQTALDGTASEASFGQKVKKKVVPLQQNAVVLFNHLPKTGGTTVCAFGWKRSAAEFHRLFNEGDIKNISERVVATLEASHNNNSMIEANATTESGPRRLFLELHGDIPGLDVLHSYIQKWRAIAEQSSESTFFAFTLLREPVSFHQSYFRHFHLASCRAKWCEESKYDNYTEQNLLRSAIPNKQCELLVHGQQEWKLISRRPPRVTKEECLHAKERLIQDWDWVGFTEEATSVVIPTLRRLFLNTSELLMQDQSIGSEERLCHNCKASVQLSEATSLRLRNMSSYDVDLYESMRHLYRRF